MKSFQTLFLNLIFVVLISHVTTAQDIWADVQPLIPSQDNSANISMNSFAMVWENQVDETTNAIYGRLTMPGAEPVLLVQITGVQCTRPKIQNLNQSLVLFETNLNGNIDIYGIALDNQGNPVGDIQPVVVTDAADHEVSYSEYYNLTPNLAWLEEGQLKTGNLIVSGNQFVLTGVITLDAEVCADPVFYGHNTNRLFWTKKEENTDMVVFSDYLMGGGWTIPTLFTGAEKIEGFQISHGQTPSTIISLTYRDNGNWFIKDFFYDYSQPQPDTLVPEVQQDHPFDVDAYYWTPGVKSGSDDWWGFLYQAYAGNVGDHDEIFMNDDDFYPSTYSNFSQMGVNCRNPRFYEGEWFETGLYLYLTWEAFVDGKWQVYYSTTPIVVGGIEENETSPVSNIVVTPNPFSDRLDISFDLEKSMPVTVDLLDIHGRVLMNLLSETCTEGSFSSSFDMTGFPCKSGWYFVRFGVDGNYSLKKVVKGR